MLSRDSLNLWQGVSIKILGCRDPRYNHENPSITDTDKVLILISILLSYPKFRVGNTGIS